MLLALWLITVLAVSRGVRSIVKVVYYTASLPYAVLVPMCMLSCTLPGATDGLMVRDG